MAYHCKPLQGLCHNCWKCPGKITKSHVWACLAGTLYLLVLGWSHLTSTSYGNPTANYPTLPEISRRDPSVMTGDDHGEHSHLQNGTLMVGGTFVIQVRGEMGNNLQRIAHGYALKWYAEDVFHFSPQLLMRHLKKPKWKSARADIHQCFPLLRTLDYEGGLEQSFVKIQKSHPKWLANQATEWNDKLNMVKDETHQNITEGLRVMKHLATTRNKPHREYPIVVLGGPMRNALIDKYYQRFREELFLFDKGNECCKQLPEPDEVVFHFRHFAKELSDEDQQLRGFEELDPDRVASELMGHLHRGQKVAITTRFSNEPIVEQYRSSMERRGFQVRIVSNQTGVQDFCFLLHAQQELLGVAKSTFARWAAYLGEAKRVQLYALDGVGSNEFIEHTMRFPWSHPEVKRRIQFPIFASRSDSQTS